MKKLVSVLLTVAVALSLGLLPAVTSADPSIELSHVGDGTAEISIATAHSPTHSVKLYVKDGSVDWAEVSIPVNITLKNISELKFWEYIASYGPATTGADGWSVNVVLGVDADDDGVFEADVAEWHVGTNSWTLAALNGDTFVEMDGAFGNPAKGVWTETDALSIAQWWTPDSSGAGFAKSDTYPWTFYDSFANLINIFIPDSNQTSLIPDANARVLCVKLQIGGSANWQDETAYVDDVTINGVTYDFEPTSSVGLTADVPDIVAISVDPTSIDYGALLPGQTSDVEQVTVTNIGTHTVDVDAEVVGDALFCDNLELYTSAWVSGPNWTGVITNLAMDGSKYVQTRLPVPSDYTPSGTETGTLVFEATAIP